MDEAHEAVTPPLPPLTRRGVLGLDRLDSLRARLQTHIQPTTHDTQNPPQRFLDRLNPSLPRRTLIKRGLVLFGMTQLPSWLVTACLQRNSATDTPTPYTDIPLPHTDIPTPIEPGEDDASPALFGFNTHLMPAPNEDPENPSTLDLERFKHSVDMMSSAGLNSLRFNLFDHYIQQGSATDAFSLNEAMMEQYDEAIAYAHDKGMQITLATNVPGLYGELPDEQYEKVAAEYFNTLGKRYAGKINLWQIFNEVDVHDFKLYNSRPDISPEYIRRFARILGIARENISTYDPDAKFSVNVSGWPLSDMATFDRWKALFNVIHAQVDTLSLNLFPTSVYEADGLGFICRYFYEMYEKPIQVGELGISTGSKDSSQAAQQALQAEILLNGIASLRQSPAQEVLIYEYSDQSHLSDQHEGNFGITDNPRIDEILRSMRPPAPAQK